MAAHVQFTPGAQVRSASILSPDRRGGRLTGPGLPAAGASAWVGAAAPPATAPRVASPPAVAYDPVVAAAREGHQSPPPYTQHAQQSLLAQQAYVALGAAEVPATARPQWRDASGRGGQAPTPQRGAASTNSSAHSLHAPVAGSGPLTLGSSPTGSRGCSAVVSISGRASGSDDGATARFTAPPGCPPALGSQGSMQPARVTIECRRQHSIGGCSGASIPSSSPGTATREPKASIEVPLTVANRNDVEYETNENTKHLRQDMKGVKDTLSHLSDLVSNLKPSEQEELAALKVEVEAAKHEIQRTREAEQRAREAGQRAQESAGEHAARLAEKARECGEVEAELRRAQQAAQEARRSAAEVREVREELEGVRRQLRAAEEQLRGERELRAREQEARDADAARAGEGEAARLLERDEAVAELERRLKAAGEECSAFRVRHRHLEMQMDQKTGENGDLQKQAEELRGRLELEAEARARERREAESRGAEARRGAEAELRAARERSAERSAERGRAERELQAGLALREAEVAAREEALAEAERGAAEGAGLQREAERELQRLRERSQELERQAQRKGADSEKENRSLKATVQDQKQKMLALQNQINRELASASYPALGELLKMSKKDAAETELMLKNHNLEKELQEVRWHNDILRKNLPRAAYESVAKELVQPLPPRDVDTESIA